MQPEQAQFVDIFKEEAAEHVRHLHRGLLALKPHPKDEMVLQETARAADTLLGSAMTMGFEGVSQHARTLRDRLFAARDGTSPLDTASLEHLLYSLEALCTDVDANVTAAPGDEAVVVSLVTVMAMRAALDQLHHEMLRLAEPRRDAVSMPRLRPHTHILQEGAKTGGLDAVAPVAQRLEDIFRVVQEGGLTLNAEILGLLWQGLGFIELLLEAAATSDDSGVEVDELCDLLDELLPQEVVEAVDTALPGSHATPRAARNEQPHATPETAHETRQGQETRPPSDIVRETVKVLIASNSTLFSRKLAHVLSQEKYEVILASDADEVASHLEHKDIDLCFVRDSLPKGLDICEQFARRSAADHVIPIIVYSPQSRVRESVLQRGAAGFLKVPCQPQDVLALVDRLCHHKPGRP